MRPRKPAEERSVSHSISCTPLQWARMKELAERIGMPTSPWIVGRVLGREGFGAGDGGHALVLDGDRQREVRDATPEAERALLELSGLSGGGCGDLRETVALLFEARLDEMARTGRGEKMEALLAAIAGPERAARIAAAVSDRTRQRP